MIDPRLLRLEPDRVRAAQAKRGLSDAPVDRALAADEARRAAIASFETQRAEQKRMGAQVARAQGDEKQALIATTQRLAAGVKDAEAARAAAEDEWTAALSDIPNLASDQTPAGGEDDFVVLETRGTPPEMDFEPRDHVELGRMHGAFDLERGAKVSGSRFYFFTGVGARLHRALMNMALDFATARGFTEVVAPALVKSRAMEGTGFLGQAADDVYRIEGQDLYLVGTSEVPMAAFHSDEILDGATLPLRYAAFSSCFRKEAGSHGKDTRGIFRVHWFDKVEMFVFTTVEEAAAEHRRLLEWEMEFMDALELHYRVIDVAAGDLGTSAERKFDCEAWIPSQGRFRELTSTSSCTDYQSRRLDIRTRTDAGTVAAATLNGTLCSTNRPMIALLETHQQPDGSVRVPEALRPYLGGLEVLKPIHGG